MLFNKIQQYKMQMFDKIIFFFKYKTRQDKSKLQNKLKKIMLIMLIKTAKVINVSTGTYLLVSVVLSCLVLHFIENLYLVLSRLIK